MLKKIAVVFAIAIIGFLAYCASKPDTFRIQRSITINAPAEKIFPYINNLHDFGSLSPYEKKDPNMKRTYIGPESGKGAAYEWEGNDEIGKGRMEITNITEPTNVTISLDFLKPFKAHNTVEFNLQPKGDTTEVTWLMYGPNEFMCKVMQTFFNMDEMCGKDFEQGLQSLKSISEK